MDLHSISSNSQKSISIWLFSLTIMTFLMIIIGGLTRLTDSGLSMVDWKPIMGTLPPLNHESWLKSFNAYKNSPEFQIVNKGMDLNSFKYIFLWEWFHRFFARCIGLVFIVPLIIFIVKKKISKKFIIGLSFIFLFGIFQAFVGWWMVKSGLNDNPYVSPYRLTFHLSNAIIILAILFWLSLNSLLKNNINFLPYNLLESSFIIIISLLFLTIITGAFMAGGNAGQSFNTYPLMNGLLIPEGYIIEDYGIRNFFENTIAVNVNHRWLATFTFTIIITQTLYLLFIKKLNQYSIEFILIFIFANLQFFLGIITLLTNVKIIYASMHQVNSILLLASLMFAYHQLKRKIEK